MRDSAAAVAGRVGRYLYVSSRAVYAPPLPADLGEAHPVVAASGDADAVDYPRDKRGAEVAVEAVFGDRAVLARAGLILGPWEITGRLPCWLLRVARGGRVLVPGPVDLPWQYVDARDLAEWLLGRRAVGCPDRSTWSARAGTPRPGRCWTPRSRPPAGTPSWCGWIPPDPQYAGLRSTNVDRATAAGLRCRPVERTVADTWAWLSTTGGHQTPGPGHPALGMDPAKERSVLDSWRHLCAGPAG